MNYNENTYTSIQCGLYLSMYMDSTCYTIMYNYNSGMYHEPRHELYYTGNTVILELNGTLETYVAKYQLTLVYVICQHVHPSLYSHKLVLGSTGMFKVLIIVE